MKKTIACIHALFLLAGAASALRAQTLRPADHEAWDRVERQLGREPLAEKALLAWVRGRGRATIRERTRAFLDALEGSEDASLYRRAAAGWGGHDRPSPGMKVLVRVARTGVDRLGLLGVTRHETLRWEELGRLLRAALPLGRRDLEEALRVWDAPEEEVPWILSHRGALGPRWMRRQDRSKRLLELGLRTDQERLAEEIRRALAVREPVSLTEGASLR